MDFYDKLARMDAQDILNHAPYETPDFFGWYGINSFLCDLVQSYSTGKDNKVLVYGDYDVDGLMCAKIMHDGLVHMGIKNVDVYNYTQRTHSLDTLAVQQAILGNYDYFVVCDTGSSNRELLQRVTNNGIRVIVLDHHVSPYLYDDYDENVAMINTEIENDILGERRFELSAGALCYVVLRKFCEENDVPFDESVSAYATVSLYSDCMNMANRLNRSIYYESRKLERGELPHLIQIFMNEYSTFGARYIGFWFAPRINALFRSESFDLLNKLTLRNPDYNEEVMLCELVESLYTRIRELTKELSDIIEVAEYNHFVVGDLQSVEDYYGVDEYKIYNYTGLVANMLSERYGKAAVVHCFAGSEIKGSVRDTFSRDYLSLFRNICNAGGHAAAFGFHLGVFDLDNFLNNLRYIDKYFSIDDIHNEPIVLSINSLCPDNVLIEDIARYNEFSGQGLPVAYIKKQVVGSMKEIRTKYNYKYAWGDYMIQSDHSLNFGTYVLLKPIKSLHTKLLVQ